MGLLSIDETKVGVVPPTGTIPAPNPQQCIRKPILQLGIYSIRFTVGYGDDCTCHLP